MSTHDKDGYVINPEPGDTMEGSTCGDCQAEDVRVTYTHTESWGNPEHPTGSVEFWHCDDCLEETDEDTMNKVVSALAKLMDSIDGSYEFKAIEEETCGLSENEQFEEAVAIWDNARIALDKAKQRHLIDGCVVFRSWEGEHTYFDQTLEELIANLVVPTIAIQDDTEDHIREWISSNPRVGDVLHTNLNDLPIERVK